MAKTNAQLRLGYQQWRATVPWTNEEIALALEATAAVRAHEFTKQYWLTRAAAVRRDRVRNRDLAEALPFLIRRCAVCGKRALYRSGNSGFCREHKYSKDVYAEAKRKRMEYGRTIREQEQDARMKSLRSSHARAHRIK